MRRTLSAATAKAHLAEALRQAENGDLVVITRYGKPAAALVGAEQLQRLERLPEAAPMDATAEPRKPGVDDSAVSEVAGRYGREPTPEGLRERAAVGCFHRIDDDLEKLPEKLRPMLELIRQNLFHRRLTVERIKAAISVGAHDVTTHFRQATGAPIRQYLEDRRLECACRLLLDTDFDVGEIARLVGYSSAEVFSRAFKRRLGIRPRVYREFDGRLTPAAAGNVEADPSPAAPRFLAAVSATPADASCVRCGGGLEPDVVLRAFEYLGAGPIIRATPESEGSEAWIGEALAPICDACAREHAPELGRVLGEAKATG